MGQDERRTLRIIPLPTLRVRDTFRVTAVLELICRNCWHTKPLDVIALACRCHYLDQRIIIATRAMPCPECGEMGCGFNVVVGECVGRMMIDVRFDQVVGAAYRIVARCWACHRRRELDPLRLGSDRRVGPDALLVDLQERMRCEGCGQRGWTRIHLER